MDFERIDIPYDPIGSDRFNGIIQYLTDQYENIEDIVTAESSSIYDDPVSFSPSSALHLKKRCMFHSKSEKNAFILYNFGKFRVKPTHCSIKAKTNSNGHFLRSWEIRGSNDKIKWDVLDKRPNEESISAIGASDTFPIQNQTNDQGYQFLQLIQTDVSSSCYYYLALTNLEFFGTIYQSEK